MAFKNMNDKYGVSYILNPEENLTTLSDSKLVSSYDNFFINLKKQGNLLEILVYITL